MTVNNSWWSCLLKMCAACSLSPPANVLNRADMACTASCRLQGTPQTSVEDPQTGPILRPNTILASTAGGWPDGRRLGERHTQRCHWLVYISSCLLKISKSQTQMCMLQNPPVKLVQPQVEDGPFGVPSSVPGMPAAGGPRCIIIDSACPSTVSLAYPR